MKPKQLLSLVAAISISIASTYSQPIDPVKSFSEDPGTHNMHICYDGKHYYTINGGKSPEGKISKFDKDGALLKEYPVELDMRSIMYNKKDKHFYVNCYDKNIYRIENLEYGTYSLLFEGIYGNDQAGLALDPKARYLYYLDNGTLRIIDFSNGEVYKTYYNIKCGPDSFSGGAVVACGKKYLYTWDSYEQLVYVYDYKMNLKGSYGITEGDYCFSLSYADGFVFVAVDGNYDVGTWYAYKIP